MPELSGHCHAASAGAAGAATAAAYVTGRDRRRTRQRDNCCNQKQIFHDSLPLRFRESSAVNTHALRARFAPSRSYWREFKSAAAESVAVRFVQTRLRRRLQKCHR